MSKLYRTDPAKIINLEKKAAKQREVRKMTNRFVNPLSWLQYQKDRPDLLAIVMKFDISIKEPEQQPIISMVAQCELGVNDVYFGPRSPSNDQPWLRQLRKIIGEMESDTENWTFVPQPANDKEKKFYIIPKMRFYDCK